MRGYLHSKDLRWSYACMKGRHVDQWIRSTVLANGQLSLAAISSAGFVGVYVDRFYLGRNEGVITTLKETVDSDPITSSDGRLVFFNFTKLGKTR
jgi:phosphoglycerol transferase